MTMKKLLAAALLFAVIGADVAYAKSIRFYDRSGRYQGRISSAGNIYNRDGAYSGRVR